MGIRALNLRLGPQTPCPQALQVEFLQVIGQKFPTRQGKLRLVKSSHCSYQSNIFHKEF